MLKNQDSMTITAIECLGTQILRCGAKEIMVEFRKLERIQSILPKKLGYSEIEK